jgi:small conductance mechanosensitive channel
MGIDIGPILAGAGIAGLAIGLGAQNLLRDVISGFFIILEDQVRVGDLAIVNGTEGQVETITFRTIVLRDLAGVVHIFPNGTITTLANMTKGWSACVIDIGVSYKEDTDRIVEIMRAVGEELRRDLLFGKKMIEPIEMLGVDRFGESEVVIKVRLKTVPGEPFNVGREYRRRIKKAFDRHGVEFPVLRRTIHLAEPAKPTDVHPPSSDRVSTEKAQ